jgi:hypothetical protein
MARPFLGFHGQPYFSKRGTDPAILPDELFRFGVQFADGSKATNLAEMHFRLGERPKRPVLQRGGGSSGEARADVAYWVWPLPPPGPLLFVCEWPAFGIPVTYHEIDSSLIRTAAAQTVPLWPSG